MFLKDDKHAPDKDMHATLGNLTTLSAALRCIADKQAHKIGETRVNAPFTG